MVNKENVDTRLAALERQMAFVMRRVCNGAEFEHWVRSVGGSLESDPEFAEMVRFGREFRQGIRDDDASE